MILLEKFTLQKIWCEFKLCFDREHIMLAITRDQFQAV